MTSCTFEPAWWLKNRHAQTIWSTLSGRKNEITLIEEHVDLPDGDFVELLWDEANAHEQDKPIVILLHGLGGNVKSPYAKGLMKAMSQHNWRPVLMHFRGSGGKPNRLDRGYHSGDTADFAFVVEHLLRDNDNLAALGVSLGGNVLLKWLGETGSHNPLRAAVAVSVPFELQHAATYVSTGISQLYQYWLLKSLRENLNNKYQNREAPFDLALMNQLNTFWEFDDLITAPLHGFEDVHDYYEKASSRQFLSFIETPTLIIHSEDDPFMPAHVIPSLEELSASTRLEVSKHGGHVGFISGDTLGSAEYWLESRVPEFFKDYLS